MNITIIESDSGRIVVQYPIVLVGQDYEPTDQEYFDEAWRCAVDDGLVEADSRSDYTFELAEPG